MTQTTNRFFDEIGRMMNDAAGAAQGVKRECDDQIQVLDRTRTLAPNVYTVYLAGPDHEKFASWEDTLVEELERVIAEPSEAADIVGARTRTAEVAR